MKMNRLVKTVLALDKLSNHHRVDLRPEEALLWAGIVESYNFATRENAVRLVEAVNSVIPVKEYGPVNGYPNPNDGAYSHIFAVGNEGSRVIYVVVRKYPKNVANANWKVIKGELEAIGKLVECDEFDMVENSEHVFEFRFWWD